jgi:hypothetical protein
MERSDRITNALTHAFVASHVVASFGSEMVRIQTSELFTHLMSNGAATEMHRDVADLLTDVWTAEVVALVQERKTYDDMRTRLDGGDRAVRARDGHAITDRGCRGENSAGDVAELHRTCSAADPQYFMTRPSAPAAAHHESAVLV